MNNNFDQILNKALSSCEDLVNEAQKISAESSPHLDKVDPKLRAKYEQAQKDLQQKKEELNNLKH